MVAKDADNGHEAETRNLCNAASGDFGNGLSFQEFNGGVDEAFTGFVWSSAVFSWDVALGYACEVSPC
jgi:hypothetical protein